MFDNNDSINMLVKALEINSTNENVVYANNDKMIALFITYINELYKDELDFSDNIENKNISKSTNLSFLSRFKTSVKLQNKNTAITEAELVELINKIKNKNLKDLTENQFNWLGSGSKDNEVTFDKYIKNVYLPKITDLDQKSEEYLKLLEQMLSDTTFGTRTKVLKIYKVKSFFKPNKLKNKITAIHGTTNHSLIQILANNFKLPKNLESSAYKYSGSALGNGVYFARLDQASKTQAYMDKKETIKYSIIADLYYDTKKDVTHFTSNNLTGKNLIHGYNLGMYDRDELVVLPSQIDIKYIIECKNK